MNKLDPRVELTHGEPIEITSSSKIIDIKANYGNNEQETIACVYHKDEQAALSIADHFCMVPEFVKAMDTWSKLQNQETMNNDEAEMLSKRFHEQMTKINNDLYGA